MGGDVAGAQAGSVARGGRTAAAGDPLPPTLVVGAVLVDDLAAPRAVLAARRSTPLTLAGRWEFPGGKVEPGEEPVHALRRELREELDLAVVVGAEVVGPVRGCWPISTQLVMRLWLARSEDAGRAGGSHDQLRWVTPATWDALDWLPADRHVLPLLAGLMRIAKEAR